MTETNPQPSPARFTRKQLISLLIVLIALGGVGYALYIVLNMPAAPVVLQPPAESGEQGVQNPEDDVNSLEDFAKYTGQQPIPEATTERSIEPIDPRRDHIRGNRSADISIVEFSSPTNKYAALLQPALAELVQNRLDVNLVYRHYPSTTIAGDYPLADMSECIARQGGDLAFWKFMDEIFARQVKTEAIGRGIAEEIGADMEELTLCMTTKISETKVIDDKRGAQAKGGFYTIPSFFFVNNNTGELRFVQGAETIAFFESVIDVMKRSEAERTGLTEEELEEIDELLSE